MNVKVEVEEIQIKEEDDPITVLDPLLQDEHEVTDTLTVVPGLCRKTGVHSSDVINVKVEPEEIHIKEEDDPIAVFDTSIKYEPEVSIDTLTVVPGLCSKSGMQSSDVTSLIVDQEEIHIKEEDVSAAVLDLSIKVEPEMEDSLMKMT